MPDPLADRLHAVQQRVAESARAAGRDPAEITTIVVTKFQPLAVVRRLYELGVRDFGESRHPEAREKAVAVPEADWHFIGQLQTNKARQVARYADVIHTVDRSALVHALREQSCDVLIQVDLAGDDADRGGTAPPEVGPLAEAILATGTLRLRGVMAVAPRGEEPSRAFDRLAGAAERVRQIAPAASWISAGMSGDFPAAIAAGATHLRIGESIVGPRTTRL